MNRWRRRRPPPPVAVLDDFAAWVDEQLDADRTLTGLALLHDWARRWADDLEALGRVEQDPQRRAYWAGWVSALRDVAAEVARGAFAPGGDRYDEAMSLPPPTELPPAPPGRRQW